MGNLIEIKGDEPDGRWTREAARDAVLDLAWRTSRGPFVALRALGKSDAARAIDGTRPVGSWKTLCAWTRPEEPFVDRSVTPQGERRFRKPVAPALVPLRNALDAWSRELPPAMQAWEWIYDRFLDAVRSGRYADEGWLDGDCELVGIYDELARRPHPVARDVVMTARAEPLIATHLEWFFRFEIRRESQRSLALSSGVATITVQKAIAKARRLLGLPSLKDGRRRRARGLTVRQSACSPAPAGAQADVVDDATPKSRSRLRSLLGVSAKATTQELEAAWKNLPKLAQKRKLALSRLHPDAGGDPAMFKREQDVWLTRFEEFREEYRVAFASMLRRAKKA